MEPVYNSLRAKDEDESTMLFYSIAAEKVSSRFVALGAVSGRAGAKQLGMALKSRSAFVLTGGAGRRRYDTLMRPINS